MALEIQNCLLHLSYTLPRVNTKRPWYWYYDHGDDDTGEDDDDDKAIDWIKEKKYFFVTSK